MVKTAWNFIIPFLLMAGAFGSRGWLLASGLCAALAIFCANFFRDPNREIPADPSVLVSPADGKVIAIEQVDDPFSGPGTEIRIFLNVFDVHVQRSPFTGPSRVESTRYYAGKFLAASVPKASLENEQHWIRLNGPGGQKVTVKQVAGLIARRIISWVRPGDELRAGQHLGLIQFGSQVDLAFSKTWVPAVQIGQRVLGGETVMARKKVKK